MAAQGDWSVGQTDGLERRAYPRHAVDCAVVVAPINGAALISGMMVDLSLGGCRMIAEHRYNPGILVRVELQFQLQGIVFRIVGVTVGSRGAKSFSIRFLDMPTRRRDELAEVLAEVAALPAAKAASEIAVAPTVETGAALRSNPEPNLKLIPARVPEVAPFSNKSGSSESGRVAGDETPTVDGPVSSLDVAIAPTAPASPMDRRSHRRHAVDTSAKLLLLNTGICMPGRILNLSQGGCRLETEERFTVGIYVRVETEFYLHGLPFRLAGVSQAVLDKNAVGVRFLDMSERKRSQLTELIAEIDEAEDAG